MARVPMHPDLIKSNERIMKLERELADYKVVCDALHYAYTCQCNRTDRLEQYLFEALRTLSDV